jgi:ABC-2 type transport system permease protein
MSLGTQVARIAAIARRDVKTESSYKLRYATRVFEVAITGVVVFNLSKLVVDAPALAKYGGDYFDFAMVGLAVMSVARLGIGTFNQNILREQSIGTMEVLLSTPTPISVLLAGSFVFPMLLTVIDLVLYFGFGLGVFGNGLRVIGVLYAIPLLVLTLASFCAFGIVSASLLVLIKRGDPLTAPFTLLTSILSGALFPVSTFPAVVQALARAFPAYYGITGLREALLTSSGWSDILPDLLVLTAFDVVLLPLSVNVFSRALAAARRSGTLANY